MGCYKKLNTITESVAQLLHHKDTIVAVLVESLADDVNQHGADAILDVISHLALDLQQVGMSSQISLENILFDPLSVHSAQKDLVITSNNIATIIIVDTRLPLDTYI